MIKRSITFTNFDDEEVTEDHYFHLSKSELIDMELSEDGGMAAKMEAITQSGDAKQILAAFKDIIFRSYGERDGGNFRKSAELSEMFIQSQAFDALFSDLLTNELAAAEFINGIVPKDLSSSPEMKKALASAGVPDPHKLDGPQGNWPALPDKDEQLGATGLKHPLKRNGELVDWAYRHPTDAELTQMNKEQLLDVMRRKSTSWPQPL